MTIQNKIDVDQLGSIINVNATDHGDVNEVGSIAYVCDLWSGIDKSIVLERGTYTISTSFEIPSNINLRMNNGAILDIVTGVTVTISGTFEAGLFQVFDWTGTGKVMGLNRIHVEWFGAKGDYDYVTHTGTDDTAAFQKTIDSVGENGGGVVLAYSKYLISELVIDWRHVTIEGGLPSFDYTVDGVATADPDLMPPSALICNSGIYALMIKYSVFPRTGQNTGIRNIAIICDVSPSVEYGIVICSGMSVMIDVLVSSFDYNITTFSQNSNVYDRVAIYNAQKIGFVCSPIGVALDIPTYQHPNIVASLGTIMSSTIFTIKNSLIRGNKFGIVLMNGDTAEIKNTVIEANSMSGLLIYKKTDYAADNIHFQNVWFEQNYAGFIITYPANSYSVTGITPLKSSSTEYLKGSVTGEWTNDYVLHYDVGSQIWIGSELESHGAGDIHQSPTNITFNNCKWGGAGNKDKLLYGRSMENCNFIDIDVSNGDKDLLFYLSEYSRDTLVKNMRFSGASALLFEATYMTTGITAGGTRGIYSYDKTGEWTPVLEGSVTPGSQTYTLQKGFYTRINNIIFITGSITLSNLDVTTSGDMKITGLPGVCTWVLGNVPSINVGYTKDITLNIAGGFYSLSGIIVPNTSEILLHEVGNNVQSVPITHADLGNDTTLYFSGFYMVN